MTSHLPPAVDSTADRFPLFPLGNVLLPGGILRLRIFEARYIDMIARTMRADSSFGVCLIAQGQEVGEAATPHSVGVAARILEWDMSAPGEGDSVLKISVLGERRFAIQSHRVSAQNIVEADIRWLADVPTPVAPRFVALQSLLRLIVADKGREVFAEPYAFDDAHWVGYRLAEVLPISALARLKLLELEDAELRLSIIFEYLNERGLLGKQ